MTIDTIIDNCGQLVTMTGRTGAPPPNRWRSIRGVINGKPRSGPAQSAVIGIQGASIAIGEGRIVAIGSYVEIMRLAQPDTKFIDAAGRLVTPGLVDPHTHLVFAGTRENEFEMRALGKTYSQIMAAGGGIHATVSATRSASTDDLAKFTDERLTMMLSTGTTTVEAKSGYGLDVETELRQLAVSGDSQSPLDIVPTYMGAHAVPAGMSAGDYLDFICREALPAVAAQGFARYCDVFCEQGVFTAEQSRRILKAAQHLGLGAKIHADELTDSGGARLAAEIGAVSADHLHCASEAGLRAMAEAGTIAVLLPGTAVYLGLTRHAPARKMIELGVPVAVGTDFNPGSCYATSLPLMMTFACSQLGMTPAEALTAVTINAACAIGVGSQVGSVEPGKQADLVIWNTNDYRQIPYQMGNNLVRSVIKRGRVVYGAVD